VYGLPGIGVHNRRNGRSSWPECAAGEDGSLYPALHKLEHEGWIKGEWRANEHNRRAKFYALTRPGQKHLDKEAANWERISSAITRVLTLKEA
jgi:DNA-binding PadR family transcriptional regulator